MLKSEYIYNTNSNIIFSWSIRLFTHRKRDYWQIWYSQWTYRKSHGKRYNCYVIMRILIYGQPSFARSCICIGMQENPSILQPCLFDMWIWLDLLIFDSQWDNSRIFSTSSQNITVAFSTTTYCNIYIQLQVHYIIRTHLSSIYMLLPLCAHFSFFRWITHWVRVKSFV